MANRGPVEAPGGPPLKASLLDFRRKDESLAAGRSYRKLPLTAFGERRQRQVPLNIIRKQEPARSGEIPVMKSRGEVGR